MKLVSNLLEGIEGIRIFYIFGLLLFFVLFIIILVRTLRIPNEEMDEIKNSILTDSESEETATS
jgi:tellurite resistance protein TehA-like permease